MNLNYDDYKIDKIARTIRCFTNAVNIEIIKLLEQHEELRLIDITEILNDNQTRISTNLYKLIKWKIIKRERKNSVWNYRLNKELVEKVIDISNSLE
jgi:predicted transcriptional regulator